MPYSLQAPPGVIVILIRHAATAANNPTKTEVRGWKDDEIAPASHLDAQLTAEKLRRYDLKYIISSDFMRDQQTAQIIAEKLNISNIDVDFDARTWDTGDFSGKPEEEVNPAILEIMRQPWLSAPGGSESYNDFGRRWTRFLESKMYLAANVDQYRPIGIVTHGRNLAYTQSYIEGIPIEDCNMPLPAGFATITIQPNHQLTMEFITQTEPVIADV